MQPLGETRSVKKRLIVGGILFILLIAGWICSGYSVLTITLNPGDSGKAQYQLLNQGNNQSTVVVSGQSNLTRIVKKASYQITVTQDKSSAFVVANTRGFFQRTTIQAQMVPQPAKQFVGNSPKACMYYLDGVLYSYDCTGALTKLVHVPASPTSPTYNLKTVSGVFGSYEDVINTKEGVLALFNSAGGHVVYVLSGNVKANDGVVLKGLDSASGAVYSIAAYKDGFIVYDSSYSTITYYASTTSEPESLSITKPTDKTQKPLSLSTSGDTIVVAYSDKADFDSRSAPKSIGKVKSEVFVYKEGQTHKYTFGKQFSAIRPCGTNKLCLLDTPNKRLSVYEIGGKSKFLYNVEGVNSISPVVNDLLAVRDDDILSLNIDKKDGYIAYQFGSNKYCGLNGVSNSGYLLCVTDSRAQNSVLLFTPGTPDTESLDKKVSKLLELPGVASVSAYGKYVFISANAGKLTYNSSLGKAVYDPIIQKAATDKINQELDKLGRGSTVFVITNGSQ